MTIGGRLHAQSGHVSRQCAAGIRCEGEAGTICRRSWRRTGVHKLVVGVHAAAGLIGEFEVDHSIGEAWKFIVVGEVCRIAYLNTQSRCQQQEAWELYNSERR